ncbi:outer membrane protein [Sphingomonas sp. LT1P40]|uniref:outer membrane protein n=1 Tax=Alteristakelama amylovorans TaxID=3096166 RepID=UPI002FC5FC92
MKKLALAALTALTLSATPVLAQETADFSGPSATVITGYDVVDLNTPGVKNPDGVIYGIGLGYDIQKGRTVFGIEAEVADSLAKLKAGAATVAETGRDLYIGGRIGVVTGQTLLYAKAGYTNARIRSPFGTADADGIRAGVGAEVKLTDSIFGKAEYRYSNYEAGVERHQGVLGLGVRF